MSETSTDTPPPRSAAIGEPVVIDDPDNRCFGCSPHNERGLGLQFVLAGPAAVECRYVAPAHLCGAAGVVHGGLQATMLDEVMGVAAHQREGGDAFDLVTVDFTLRYRRPVRTETPIVVRGELDRVEGADFYLSATIEDEAGEVLTRAEARWRRVDRRRRARD